MKKFIMGGYLRKISSLDHMGKIIDFSPRLKPGDSHFTEANLSGIRLTWIYGFSVS